MGIAAALPSIFGGITSGYGLLQGFKGQRRTNQFYRTDPNFGRVEPGQQADYHHLMGNVPEDQQDNAQTQISQTTRRVPGAWAWGAQQGENQAALDRQAGYADQQIEAVKGGSLGASNEYVRQQLTQPGGPQAITQDTFDRMAAQLSDQANAAARNRSAQTQAAAARSGAGPSSVANLQQNDSFANEQQISSGLRDLLVQRQLANSDYATRLASLGGSIGGQYSDALGNALYTRGSLEQPIDFQSLGDLQLAFATGGLNAQNEASQAQANQSLGLGTGLFQIGSANRNADVAAAAADKPWYETLGPAAITAGGAAAAATARPWWLA